MIWLAPLVLTGVAFVLRAAGQAEVFVDSDVVPIGGEAWYHLRRHAFAVFEYPARLAFDPFLRFASGAVPPWAPGFDTLIGRLALLAADGEEVAAAQRIAAWAPTLAGALCVPAVFALLVRRFGVGAALIGAALLTVLPAHVLATQVGYVNHRAAGALLGLLVLVAMLPLLRVGEASRQRGIGLALVAGAVSALALWVSMSAWLPIAFAHTVLFLHVLTRASAQDARSAMLRVAAVELVTLAGVALFAWPLPHTTADAYSFVYPSRLHVVVFGAWFGVAAVTALAWRSALGESFARRALVFLGIGLVADASSLMLVPALWDAVLALPASLFGDPSLHAAELEPALGGLASLGELVRLLSAFAPALPILLGLALLLEWRSEGRAELLALVGFSAALAAAAWFAPGEFALGAASVALAVGCAVGAIMKRTEGGALAWGGVTLAALLVAAPALSDRGAVSRGARGIQLGQGHLDPRVASDVLGWLGRESRSGGKFFDVDKAALYSVMAPWQLGHRLQYQSQRAPFIDSFYPSIAPGRRQVMEDLYRLPAYRASRAFERFGTQYVIVPDLEGFPGGELPRDSLLTALLRDDGSEVLYEDGRTGFAVSNLRLVYEHGDRDAGGGLRVYERVRGARVVGASMPDRVLRFRLRLRTSTGREFSYEATTQTDPYWGHYNILLPYGTRETKRTQYVEALGPWQVECNDEVETLEFSDWKVRDGAQVSGPGFCY